MKRIKRTSLVALIVCALTPTDASAQAGSTDRSADRTATTTPSTPVTPSPTRSADLDDDDDDKKDYGWVGLLGLLGLAGLMRRPKPDRVIGTTTTRSDVR